MKKSSLVPGLFLGLFLSGAGCAQKAIAPADSQTPGIFEKKKSLSFFMSRPQPMEPVTLVADNDYIGRPPKNYRKNPSLRMSASAAFGALGLRDISREVPGAKKNLYIFDLRQESHGLINDVPVTWTAEREWGAAGLNHDEAIRRERRLLRDLRIGEIWNGRRIDSLETEESMVRSAGYEYVRLTVTEHVRPTDAETDRFIRAVQNLPPQAWVHFHDYHGRGRSTMFMMMYEFLLRAADDSFEAITQKNLELSGEPDFFAPVDDKDWRAPYQKERTDFLHKFYHYAKEHPRGQDKLWSQWLAR